MEFDFSTSHVMVNATLMAKAFDKRLDHFLRAQDTEAFIEAMLFPPFGGNIGVHSRQDLIVSKSKKGTYMHRVLALKFAGWLDATFEVWVYNTIDHLLFGKYREMENQLRSQAARKKQIEDLETKLKLLPEFQHLESLRVEERQMNARMASQRKTQLELFKLEM
jgi:hypothetical protein